MLQSLGLNRTRWWQGLTQITVDDVRRLLERRLLVNFRQISDAVSCFVCTFLGMGRFKVRSLCNMSYWQQHCCVDIFFPLAMLWFVASEIFGHLVGLNQLGWFRRLLFRNKIEPFFCFYPIQRRGPAIRLLNYVYQGWFGLRSFCFSLFFPFRIFDLL